jgi:shikimate kinase / 3-dehydroquinate synthase
VATSALNRHLALVGFMGAGKTTLGAQVAARLGRTFVDVDRSIEETAHLSIAELFATEGESAFRRTEASVIRGLLASTEPSVLALGGGAVTREETRVLLREARVVLVDVDVDTAWERVRGSDRPLAQSEVQFRDLFAERERLYAEVAGAVATDVDGVVLGAGGVHHELGALDSLGELVPGDGPVALVADAHVMGIHGPRAQTALGGRLAQSLDVPAGEAAKDVSVVQRLWSELRLDRGGTIVALGGGCTTDVAGFVAATYLRGVPWVAVPTTLVGQVDAALGGKTAIDIPEGKNLAGAFHWPAGVVLDEALLETLPERERRQGSAELVKTELLAGRSLDVRAAAAYKIAICLRDPHDHGPRRWLNLGHTFAHALEAAADFVRLDPERAWQALLRDKKRTGDAINVVLLGDDGPTVEARPADDVRRELERLIA